MEVRAQLVSTIRLTPPPERPRQTTESWSPDEPSMLTLGNRFSRRTPTPSPELKLAPAAGRLEPSGLVRSSVASGGGLGLRGEVRMRAGFETGESSVCG